MKAGLASVVWDASQAAVGALGTDGATACGRPADALAKDEKLEAFSGVVEDLGEGRWTAEAAVEAAVPADGLTASLFTRFRSRQRHTFVEKVSSAVCFFGRHVEPGRK